jgi:phenylalanyl-tRNA synthetase beta subunit
VEWQIKETTNPSFIEGRVGKVIVSGVAVGVVGEVNPLVLEAWKLENPAAAFELSFQQILVSKLNKPMTNPKQTRKLENVSEEHDKYLYGENPLLI